MQLKEGFRDQLKKSFEPIPELADELNEEEFETEDVSVTITELSTSDLAKTNHWIGQNRPKYSDDEEEDAEATDSEPEPEEAVPGMGLYVAAPKKTIKKPSKKIVADGEEEVAEDATKPEWPLSKKNIKSKRELGVVVAKDALQTLKNSKAFQQKQRLDMLQDRKKARRLKTNRIKVQEQKARRNKGHVNERKIKRRMKLKRKGKK